MKPAFVRSKNGIALWIVKVIEDCGRSQAGDVTIQYIALHCPHTECEEDLKPVWVQHVGRIWKCQNHRDVNILLQSND